MFVNDNFSVLTELTVGFKLLLPIYNQDIYENKEEINNFNMRT